MSGTCVVLVTRHFLSRPVRIISHAATRCARAALPLSVSLLPCFFLRLLQEALRGSP